MSAIAIQLFIRQLLTVWQKSLKAWNLILQMTNWANIEVRRGAVNFSLDVEKEYLSYANSVTIVENHTSSYTWNSIAIHL